MKVKSSAWSWSTAGLESKEHHYFIEVERLFGAVDSEDTLDHWYQHLKKKNWFTPATRISFLEAYDQLKKLIYKD